MKEKNTVLDAIIDDIFKLDSPKIEKSRKQQIKDFVVSAINGDNPITYLTDFFLKLDQEARGLTNG